MIMFFLASAFTFDVMGSMKLGFRWFLSASLLNCCVDGELRKSVMREIQNHAPAIYTLKAKSRANQNDKIRAESSYMSSAPHA